MPDRDFIKDVLYGVAIGDALGVPVEFKPRMLLKRNPVTKMLGYGTHQQPPGTWSDDSSLTFCLAEMLCGGFDLHCLANHFINWKNHAYWTARGNVFDIGIGTHLAIDNLIEGITPVNAGGDSEGSNGNGSLMRVLPLLFFIKDMKINDRFLYIKDISSLTHRHSRCVISCFIYLEFALALLKGLDKLRAYNETCNNVSIFLNQMDIEIATELETFNRILSADISKLHEKNIHSSGYVIHTLEAAFWCILNTTNFKDAVLKAVNLGEDADTTAAVTGGLAGVIYGWEEIPGEWLGQLARINDIEDLSKRLNKKYMNNIYQPHTI